VRPGERSQLIERYVAGRAAVLDALARVPQEALDRAPAGEWSARMIVHHLADAELFRSVRLRRILAEESPRSEAFEEPEYARRLRYDRPVEASLALFESCVRSNAELFRLLSQKDWRRTGRHSEFGDYTVEYLLQRSAAHPHEHAAQIARLVG